MRSIVVRAAQQGRVMYDWIIEADIYRYRKEAEASLARRQLDGLVRKPSRA
jgi:hypothetical protein